MEDVCDSDELITRHNDSTVSSKLLKHKICSHKSVQCSIGQIKFLGFWFQTPVLTKMTANTPTTSNAIFLNCYTSFCYRQRLLLEECYQLHCYLFLPLCQNCYTNIATTHIMKFKGILFPSVLILRVIFCPFSVLMTLS